MAWNRQLETEQRLVREGMKAKFKPDIAIKDIDVSHSEQLNARSGKPFNKEVVEKYALNMKLGVIFPAIVLLAPALAATLYGNKTGKYLILGGMHRFQGFLKASLAKILDAYIVTEATELQCKEFTRYDNICGSLPLIEEDVIRFCVELNRKDNKSIKYLNDKYFGGIERTLGRLRDECQIDRVRTELTKQEVPVGRIKAETLSVLHNIKDTAVLKEVGTLIGTKCLDVKAVQEIVESVKESAQNEETTAEQLETVRKKTVEVLKKIKGEIVEKEKNPEDKLSSRLVKLQNLLDKGCNGKCFPPLDQLVTDADKRKLMKKLVKSVVDRLTKLI